MKYKIILFIIFFLCIFIFSCITKNININQDFINKVYLKIFENDTIQYSLNTNLNDYLKDEMLKYSNFSFELLDVADFIIDGKIVFYEIRPMSYNIDNYVESYNESITVHYFIKDKFNNIIFEDDIVEDEIFFTKYGNSFETKTETELEKEAQQKILFFIAKNISKKLSKMNFYDIKKEDKIKDDVFLNKKENLEEDKCIDKNV